jgi:hypothetical protein
MNRHSCSVRVWMWRTKISGAGAGKILLSSMQVSSRFQVIVLMLGHEEKNSAAVQRDSPVILSFLT